MFDEGLYNAGVRYILEGLALSEEEVLLAGRISRLKARFEVGRSHWRLYAYDIYPNTRINREDALEIADELGLQNPHYVKEAEDQMKLEFNVARRNYTITFFQPTLNPQK